MKMEGKMVLLGKRGVVKCSNPNPEHANEPLPRHTEVGLFSVGLLMFSLAPKNEREGPQRLVAVGSTLETTHQCSAWLDPPQQQWNSTLHKWLAP
jgi:hypothetical protein